jgi:drug/metabolite transporter (DMT)-like permease
MRIAILTALTMVAFAANSLLCRMALGAELIDPVSFTTLRLASGAFVLLPLARWSDEPRSGNERAGSWASGLALFTYAIAFSLAYVSLETGMGALILFGAVQVTMIGGGLRSGERPRAREWLGLIAAVAGLVYLVSPGMTAPDSIGALLMAGSGVAWGVYSLRGKGARAPVFTTAGNFARTVPMAVIASAFGWTVVHAERPGIVLALVSGTITSGLGYVLWYKALVGLTAIRAAIVQLIVPVLAAFAGVLVLDEEVTVRLAVASVLILGGVAVAVVARSPSVQTPSLNASTPQR